MNRDDIIRMAREAALQRRAVRKVDDIIRMAREAGFICLFPDEAVNGIGTIYDSGDEEITEMMERFAALVAAHEREACAQVCDKRAADYRMGFEEKYEAQACAYDIRARGEA